MAQSLNNFDPYVKNDSAKSIQIKTTTTKNPSYNESKKEALESLMAMTFLKIFQILFNKPKWK